MSKAILGATLTSGADGASSTNALGQVHNEVRQDIAQADARQVAATLTRDLLYPLLALNKGGLDGLRRCPRFVFLTEEAEDLESLAQSLPPLVAIGVQVPVAWVNERAKIPLPGAGEAVLGAAPSPTRPPVGQTAPAALAALVAQDRAPGDAADGLAEHAAPALETLIAAVGKMVDQAADLPGLQSALLKAYGGLETGRLTQLMAASYALAELKGMDDVAHGR